MDIMITEKPTKALTVKQLLSRKEQGSKQHSDEAKETFERAGLIVFRYQLLIDVRQQAPGDAENRLITMSRECLNRFISCRLVPGELSESGLIRSMADYFGVRLCQVNDQFLLTAEKIGNVAVWHYSIAVGAAPAIVGIDAQGNRRAVIACVE